jgi:hypothetical protein
MSYAMEFGMMSARKSDLVLAVIKVNIYLVPPCKESGLTKRTVRAHMARKLH